MQDFRSLEYFAFFSDILNIQFILIYLWKLIKV
jgi:hypothetical protein